MSRKPFTLYWSSLEQYENCPQKFLWSNGWEDIDLGAGPGKRKPKPVEESRHHAIMGQVIGWVIEKLYNDELYRTPNGLPERLLEMVGQRFELELTRQYVDWRQAGNREELLQICKDGVLGFLRTMKHNRLLGPYARAEVDLVGYTNKYTPVGGRADLIIRRDDTGITILDGKNSKQKGKYTNPDQLVWYALMFFLAHGVLPNRLGFIYFRYPHNEATGESGVDWVEFTRDDVRGLALRSIEARKGMDKRKFDPTPSPSVCKFCPYETVCDARVAQKLENSRRPKNDPLAGLSETDSGIIELGFGKGGKNNGDAG